MTTDWIRYANQGATRSQPLASDLVNALSFLPELGLEMEVFSGGQPAPGQGPRVGSTRHDHGNAADVFFYRNGERLDWSNPAHVPIFQDVVRRAKANGVTGFGAGDGYMQPGSVHIGFGNPAVWGADGKGANAAPWLREVAFSEGTTAPQTASEQRPGLLGRASTDPLVGSSGNDTLGATPMAEPSAVSGLLSRLLNREPAAPLSPMAPKERGSLWDRLKSPDTLANLAIGLQGMTIDPNEGFIDAMQSGIERRGDDDRQRRTVEWLAQQPGGADYAAAISAGMSPQAAIDGFMDARQGPDAMEQLQLARAGLGLQADELKLAELQNGGGDPGVRASQILPDGTVVQSTDTGPRVYTPGGELLTGEAAAEAVRAAQEYGTAQQRSVYAARQEGTLGAQIDMGGAAESAKKGGQIAAEAGLDAYKTAVGIQRGISTIDEAIAAIDSGAQSGVVYNMLPNITIESASLNNAMDRMGLDIVSATTFGALSEGELRLAMETAVPRNLEPKHLREWLSRRREAQAKSASMLEDAALYLSTPGNTLGGWIEKNRSNKQSQPAQQPAPQAAPQSAPAQPQQAPQPAPQPEQPAAPQAMPTPAQIAGMTAQDAATFFNGIQDLSQVPDAILEALIERANK